MVLFDNNAPLINLESPNIMLGSMEGDAGFEIPIRSASEKNRNGDMKYVFHGRGKMIRPKLGEPQNTKISAVITIRNIKVDSVTLNPSPEGKIQKPGVIVWENRFAEVPLPRELFCGPYDARWGPYDESIALISSGTKFDLWRVDA